MNWIVIMIVSVLTTIGLFCIAWKFFDKHEAIGATALVLGILMGFFSFGFFLVGVMMNNEAESTVQSLEEIRIVMRFVDTQKIVNFKDSVLAERIDKLNKSLKDWQDKNKTAVWNVTIKDDIMDVKPITW